MAKVTNKVNGKSSYTQKVSLPDISYHDAISSYIVVDGMPYAFINLTGEQFAQWLRAVVPAEQSDIPAFLLEAINPVEPVEFWYCIDCLCRKGIQLPLYSSREQAIKASQQASGVV